MSSYGCQSMASKMTQTLMRRPGASLCQADPKLWHYNELFDPEKAQVEHQQLVDLLVAQGVDIVWIEDNNDGLCDAMFTRDASFVTRHGAVLLQMGKNLRKKEPQIHAEKFRKMGIPILGQLTGSACIEGGDTIWLDEKTLVIGLGFRSNREGVRQLNALLNPFDIQVLGFDLPYWSGEEACLHLMSVISPLAEDKYLVHPPLIPSALWSLIKEKGIKLIVAPEEEFAKSYGLNLNVLPVTPNHCIMIDGFPKTKAVMEENGVEVQTFSGSALCMACEGGPTCLTNPIKRV